MRWTKCSSEFFGPGLGSPWKSSQDSERWQQHARYLPMMRGRLIPCGQDLLTQDIGVPAMLRQFAQHVQLDPAQRQRPAPIAGENVIPGLALDYFT